MGVLAIGENLDMDDTQQEIDNLTKEVNKLAMQIGTMAVKLGYVEKVVYTIVSLSGGALILSLVKLAIIK